MAPIIGPLGVVFRVRIRVRLLREECPGGEELIWSRAMLHLIWFTSFIWGPVRTRFNSGAFPVRSGLSLTSFTRAPTHDVFFPGAFRQTGVTDALIKKKLPKKLPKKFWFQNLPIRAKVTLRGNFWKVGKKGNLNFWGARVRAPQKFPKKKFPSKKSTPPHTRQHHQQSSERFWERVSFFC